jgi:hypothetical protein
MTSPLSQARHHWRSPKPDRGSARVHDTALTAPASTSQRFPVFKGTTDLAGSYRSDPVQALMKFSALDPKITKPHQGLSRGERSRSTVAIFVQLIRCKPTAWQAIASLREALVERR